MKTLALFVGLAIVGAAGGFVVRNLTQGGETPGRTGAASVWDCPESQILDDYSPGSRIYATGRTEDSAWVQVRDLSSPDRSVWIHAADVDLDGDIAGLPVAECPQAEGEIVVASTTTTTTISEGSTTTTLPPSTTTTRQSTTTTRPSTTTTGPPTTTTTAPPDTTAPQFSQPSAKPTEIWEEFSNLCTGSARQSTISAVVTDNVAVSSVTASWTIGGSPTTVNMAKSGDSYSTTFGPFAYGTVPSTPPSVIEVTITATDGNGNTQTASTKVTVHSADECLS